MSGIMIIDILVVAISLNPYLFPSCLRTMNLDIFNNQ